MPRGSDRSIDVDIGGAVTGQVAAGDNIVQTGDVHGDLVVRVALAELPAPQPLPSPVVMRPRAFAGLLDREEELQQASQALEAEQSIGLCGEAGLGKSVLLRRIAYLPECDTFPDGVVYLSALHLPVADLRQELFAAFYECQLPTKPTEAQIQQALQAKRALVLLDDLGLSREEAEALMSLAPHCTFLLSSEDRLLWGEGCDLSLRGLPLEAAMELVERKLGRPLAPDEVPQARAVCEALHGHPLRILQAAGAVGEEKRSFAALAVAARASAPAQALAASVAETLSESQRHVLLALAALGGAPTGAGHIAAVAENEDAAADLEALQRLEMVQEHGLQYRLQGVSAAALPGAPDLSPWLAKALNHFASWGERLRHSARAILGESAAMLMLIDQGAAKEQWAEVLRLVKVVEEPLTLAGRWQAWENVLQQGLRAAQALGDRGAEAWARHQAGVRALALGDTDRAQELLRQALTIRRSIGDQIGAVVTKQNLDIASGTIAPPELEPAEAGLVVPASAKAVALKLLAVLLVLGAGGFLALRALSPPELIDLQVRPQVVDGGGFTALTVALNKDAPDGGMDVTLASSESVVQVPIRVRVPAGGRKRSVLIGTKPVLTDTRVTITAAHEDSLQAASLEVRPVGRRVRLRVTLTPATVTGGGPVEGTIDLDKPASAEGLAAVQSSQARVARAPTSVAIPPGAEQVRFRLDTSTVEHATPVTVTVSYAGVNQSAELRVQPGLAQLARITFERSSVTAGTRVLGMIALSGPAPEGGAAVTLSPSDSAVEVASPVTVPAGKTSARFAAAASEVEARRIVEVTATLGSESRSATLLVEPQGPQLAALEITPAEVTGGEPARGVARLAREAPRDITVRLSSSTSAVAAPQAVTIARGKSEAGFSLQTTRNPRLVDATLTASYGSFTRSARLRLLPIGPSLAGVSLDRTSVRGGEVVSGLVTLSDQAPEDVTITLATSSPAAKAPRQVTVPAGGLSTPFAVRTAAVRRPITARVTASWGGVSRRASLTIGSAPVQTAAARLATLVATPKEVRAGAHIGVMVRLDRPAPEGAQVQLTTDRREVVLPETVQIERGEREGTVVADTEGVRQTLTATINASYGGVTKTAQVRVVTGTSRVDLTDLSVSPPRVQAGETTTGIVTLSGAAPGKVVVDLATESRWVRLPKQVAVPAGSASARFPVATSNKLRSALPVVISATLSSVTKTTSLTIEGKPPATEVALANVSVSPTTVQGGNAVTGTVVLSRDATADTPVSLSANSRVVGLPREVTVAAGNRSRDFSVTTAGVTAPQTATITASWRSASKTASLTVTPAPADRGPQPEIHLESVAVAPRAFGAGGRARGTVRLSARARQATTVAVSSNRREVRVSPELVTIRPGQREGFFEVSTRGVRGKIDAVVIAGYGREKQTANVTVTPPPPPPPSGLGRGRPQ